ncbi:hypothetical protein RQP53_22020 [Paucibacter sp. APW11]|uniref:Lipoprotein SmpA/OmlA domain-containing protein n=1 Tax=Roseateles aquae TaxID=3077235 RepID=A0ABU3PHS1_9BURK|nr:hypothetical protein [Paucibacter sp. APW11]MDT9001970.1 hypothetical protein [Paucibacter sp. APW11]
MSRALLTALVVALAGCTTVGNGQMKALDAQQAAQWLQPGRTSRAEAEQKLGRGSVLRFESSGWETWHYFYKDGLPKFLDFVPVVGLVTERVESGSKELVLLFDQHGVLRKYALREQGLGLKPQF